MDVFSRIETAGPDEVLLELSPAIARRVAGAGSLGLLGALMVWLGFTGDGAAVARIGLIVFGSVGVFGAQRLWLSSARALELTPTEFRETGGRVICRIENVAAVERGMSVLKPSNGFLIRTHARMPPAFAPGRWWRIGRRIGVGGLTNAGQGKAVVEVIQKLINR